MDVLDDSNILESNLKDDIDDVIYISDDDTLFEYITDKDDEPYHIKTKIVKVVDKLYNPKFGDNRICVCGHEYYRHFDSWDDMFACGCKYCGCSNFIEVNGK